MAGQRSNQLNYVPSLFYLPLSEIRVFIGFPQVNRFACFACFSPVERNLEVNGYQDKTTVRNLFGRQSRRRAAVPAPPPNCIRVNSDRYRLGTLSQGF